MLQLTLLGSPSATLDGVLLTDKLLNKELALLYYMAAEGQQNAMPSRNLGGHLNEHLDEHLDGLRQSRAALAVLFWGDHLEAAAHASLRKALSNLRQLLGGHIVITRSEVMLVRKQCTVDLWEFERLAAIGLSACEPAQLQAAAALYRGTFLAGFGVHEAVDFEDWTRTQQERLRGLAVQILTVMAAACAAHGDGAQAIAAQRRILEFEPWREETHCELMLLLAQSGQRSAALAQYKACVEVLAAELGVEPSPPTMELAARIRGSEGLASAFANPAPQLSVLTYAALPREHAAIVGRERELGELSAMLLDPDCRLVTILGMGGIGKTRLALALAHRLSGQYAQIAMISLAAITRAADILPALGRALGVAGTGEDGVIAALREADPDLLLVLDNFEHLLPDGATVLDQLLGGVTRLRCIVTSRAALSTRWEWRYPLGELTFPPEFQESEPAAYSSVEMFLQIARRMRPGHHIEGTELNQVMRICRLVGGMPLGVELAAAQAGSLACEVIAEQIADGIDRLAADLRDLPLRQRSLAASFNTSWAALTSQEQTALARLSVIQGEFTLEAALRIAAAAVADITRLVDKSLVRPVNGNRYSMHAVIKQHAAGRLALAPGLASEAAAAYRAYYTGWAESNLHHYTAPALHYRETIDQLENHLQHLWYLWTNSQSGPERDQIAVALMETELARRSYLDTRTGVINTWDGMQAFADGYTQAPMTYTGVLVIDMVWLPWIADQLADLTSEFTAEEVDSWIPEVADACHFGGRLLAVPKDLDFGLLFYRNDLLGKYGIVAPPATWDELEQMAAVIQAGERAAGRCHFWGFLWPGQKPEGLTCTALEWQHSEGGGCIIERDGRISIANVRAAAALTRAAARWVGTISPINFGEMTETDVIRTWEDGDAAFVRLWPGYLAVRLRGAMKSATGVCIMPRGTVRHAAALGGWPLVVHKSFRQRSAAFDLLKAVAAPDVQRRRARQIDAAPPAIQALYHDPDILAVHPFLQDIQQMIANGGLAVRPIAVAGTRYTQVAALYSETVTSILSGKVEASPALADLERQLVELGGWPTAEHH